jgi:putative ABC transport system permease protein
MHTETWKFEKDNIVYVPYTQDIQYETFVYELETNPNITDYALSSALPGKIERYSGVIQDDKMTMLAIWDVSFNFLDFFGIPVEEGELFKQDVDSQLIVNQKFILDYGLEEAIGKEDVIDCNVVGVVGNINFQTLSNEIKPMAFYAGNDRSAYHYIFIKINGQNIPATFDFIEKTWKKTNQGDFDIHFLDESLDDLYKETNNLAKLITLFGFIALIIALMGVYGIVLFNAKHKVKEIAIRKINGSTVTEILFMLNQNILVQLVIAFIIAIPAAYYITAKWLESFAYKIPVYWWVFVLGGLIVLAVTLITVSAQSYRAATRNPAKALNSE